MSKRPTTLLHDNWGASREWTDEELAEIARRDKRREQIGGLMVAVVVFAVFAFLGIWLFGL